MFQFPSNPNYTQGQPLRPRSTQQNFNPQKPFPLFQPALYGQQRNNNPMNLYKTFPNWNYFWTHRHNVKHNPTSATCCNPTPGHVWHATKQNLYSGSTSGEHKIMHPNYSYLSLCTNNDLTNHPTCTAYPCNNLDDDDEIIVTSNKWFQKPQETTQGLLNSWASNHFLTVQSTVKNRRPTSKPITVFIPDRTKITLTEECDVNWPDLPKQSRKDIFFHPWKTMH